MLHEYKRSIVYFQYSLEEYRKVDSVRGRIDMCICFAVGCNWSARGPPSSVWNQTPLPAVSTVQSVQDNKRTICVLRRLL
jgi:hypothetical protein